MWVRQSQTVLTNGHATGGPSKYNTNLVVKCLSFNKRSDIRYLPSLSSLARLITKMTRRRIYTYAYPLPPSRPSFQGFSSKSCNLVLILAIDSFCSMALMSLDPWMQKLDQPSRKNWFFWHFHSFLYFSNSSFTSIRNPWGYDRPCIATVRHQVQYHNWPTLVIR